MSGTSDAAAAVKEAEPVPGERRSPRLLDLVQTLNERCLDLLAQMSLAEAPCSCPLAALTGPRNLWRGLEPAIRRRLAQLPFVIVDIHFLDSEWWQRARQPLVCDSRAERNFNCLRDGIGTTLMQETLIFVWHAVQSDRRTAVWNVGVSREVVEIIWQLTTQDMLRIAATFSCEARPRWSERAELWRRMIEAAQSDDPTVLNDVQRHAKLRLTGDLIATRR